MTEADHSKQLREQVAEAVESGRPLAIRGSGSKDFLGHRVDGDVLEVGKHRGVVSYAPTELVVTVRAGTPVSELEKVLAERGQMLPFDPPSHGDTATIGGVVACGLSGPRRPFAGSARDYVLGMNVINGRAEMMTFGGQVMKNVAGYDVSRLLTGSMGTLAVLLDISFKVLPLPEAEATRSFAMPMTDAHAMMKSLAARAIPVSATAWQDGVLRVRLSGSEAAVAAAGHELGGDEAANDYWHYLRHQRSDYFDQQDKPGLWRLSVPAAAPLRDLQGEALLDWNGAQRWLRTDLSAQAVRDHAAGLGGHATLYQGNANDVDVFQPLPKSLVTWHRRIKGAFDPHNILNPGRMYRDLEPEPIDADAIT
ncbi:MAG: glycolate oxidase subunit GlcE [Gammaproteobacteria bacterium]|nr:glycolate oxidase subunit GlcE [Gammaproteobacteria bacterium]